MSTVNENKSHQYAMKLIAQVSSIFDEDCDNRIDPSDLEDDKNATEFMHALMNIMPAYMFNKLSGDEKNFLEVNHVANQLVFQYSEKS